MDVPTPPAVAAEPRVGGWTEPGAHVPWSAPPVPRPSHRLPRERSAAWAGLLGWLVPGAGQMFVGRWGAGLVLLLVVGATFLGGWALTDFSCVDPRTYQLEFVAHGLIGGPTALAMLARDVHLERMPPWIEVGRLYVVVAGFLNLVALCDALGECWRRNARIQALRARLSARTSRLAWDDAAFPSLAEVAPEAEPLPSAFPTQTAPLEDVPAPDVPTPDLPTPLPPPPSVDELPPASAP